uniref:Uncharacterized protein n=1 Tax=Geobacter sp. (strain M21) TaxID=443144 RepID=C6E130_GEOSM
MTNRIQKVNSNRRGFQRLNTFFNAYEESSSPITAYNIKTDEMKKFVCENGRYDFFITLTFAKGMRLSQCCIYTNTLIHRFNSKLFGRDYRNKCCHVDGFAFLERHKNEISKNENHIHMLIKGNPKLNLHQHRDIFYRAASNILDDRDDKVFNKKCIDLRHVGDGGRARYCFKNITDQNLDRVKMIGKDGLSDNL